MGPHQTDKFLYGKGHYNYEKVADYRMEKRFSGVLLVCWFFFPNDPSDRGPISKIYKELKNRLLWNQCEGSSRKWEWITQDAAILFLGINTYLPQILAQPFSFVLFS